MEDTGEINLARSRAPTIGEIQGRYRGDTGETHGRYRGDKPRKISGADHWGEPMRAVITCLGLGLGLGSGSGLGLGLGSGSGLGLGLGLALGLGLKRAVITSISFST